MVLRLAGVGLSQKQIAKWLNCTVEELTAEYRRELKRAIPEMRAKVGARLFQAARGGDVRAIIFWLKTRAGWSETGRRGVAVQLESEPEPVRPGFPGLTFPCNAGCAQFKFSDPELSRRYYSAILQRDLPRRDPAEYGPVSEQEANRRRNLISAQTRSVWKNGKELILARVRRPEEQVKNTPPRFQTLLEYWEKQRQLRLAAESVKPES